MLILILIFGFLGFLNNVKEESYRMKSFVSFLNEQESHKIASGDTLGGIAKKYGTTVKELQRLNKIEDPNKISAGASISLPSRPKQESTPTRTTSRKDRMSPEMFSLMKRARDTRDYDKNILPHQKESEGFKVSPDGKMYAEKDPIHGKKVPTQQGGLASFSHGTQIPQHFQDVIKAMEPSVSPSRAFSLDPSTRQGLNPDTNISMMRHHYLSKDLPKIEKAVPSYSKQPKDVQQTVAAITRESGKPFPKMSAGIEAGDVEKAKAEYVDSKMYRELNRLYTSGSIHPKNVKRLKSMENIVQK